MKASKEILIQGSAFRPATKADYEAICGLITSPEELFLVHPAGVYPWTVSQIETLAEQRIALTVRIENHNIIGFSNLYNHDPGQSAFIGNVVVEREHRGRGLGKGIVAHMLDRAYNEYDLPVVRISVFSTNTRALLLYQSFGFRPYDIELRSDPQDRPVPLIHMQLQRP